ncbi:hypothetical protein HMPREF9555_02162 [Selenomonas artemidis F0399]|uniref:Uncharacterized protein n=1 Tax=Selenomonas artemidis F0399 TaxID=749551 RepID=E7N567_9FIRM|nr:hypothetical protein HMPREF9555_02162 [Selenomonas artemidis F0399]
MYRRFLSHGEGAYSRSRSFYPHRGRRAPTFSFRTDVAAPQYCPAVRRSIFYHRA